MDCPSGDLVIVEQRERRHSRGDANSDSSSKDGSIQSDTSLDSEDSCVSVIFVPHPENAAVATGTDQQGQQVSAAAVAEMVMKKQQRSTSNSSESSSGESAHSAGGGSGRGSPMSPGSKAAGSPIKGGNGVSKKGCGPSPVGMDFVRQQSGAPHPFDPSTGKIIGHAYVDEAVGPFGADSMLYFVERSLESIEEKESESDEEQKDVTKNALDVAAAKKEKELLVRRLSNPKSFEMEDLPPSSPKNRSPGCGHSPLSFIPPPRSAGVSPGKKSSTTKFDYPIVRHNPLFAKQKSGERSNLSSLLLGQNVRVIRRSVGGIGEQMTATVAGGNTGDQTGNGSRSAARMRIFEIFNPETDDMDSDDEASDDEEEEEEESDESTPDSNDSVESVVSVCLKQEQPKPPQVIITEPTTEPEMEEDDDADEEIMAVIDSVTVCSVQEEKEDETNVKEVAVQPEPEKPIAETKSEEKKKDVGDDDDLFARKAEERQRVLQSLLEENKSVLTNIVAGVIKKRQESMEESFGSGNDEEADEEGQSSTGSRKSSSPAGEPSVRPKVPEYPPPQTPPKLSVPSLSGHQQRRKRLDKARSVSPSSCGLSRAGGGDRGAVVRQSSVPSRFDEIYVKPTTEMEIRTRQTCIKTTSLSPSATTTSGSSQSPSGNNESRESLNLSEEIRDAIRQI
jgi:hypothetical protein